MKPFLKYALAGSCLSFSLFSIAGESGVDAAYVYSDDHVAIEKPMFSIQAAADNWVQMNDNGTKWNLVHGGIIAVFGAGGSDRSLERFQARSYATVPWIWAKVDPTTIQMDGKGSRDYYCPTNYVVTGMYYEDSGDDSVEAFQCRKLGDHKVGYRSWITVSHSGENTYCPVFGKPTYLVGMSYVDSGDDYVKKILCAFVDK